MTLGTKLDMALNVGMHHPKLIGIVLFLGHSANSYIWSTNDLNHKSSLFLFSPKNLEKLSTETKHPPLFLSTHHIPSNPPKISSIISFPNGRIQFPQRPQPLKLGLPRLRPNRAHIFPPPNQVNRTRRRRVQALALNHLDNLLLSPLLRRKEALVLSVRTE